MSSAADNSVYGSASTGFGASSRVVSLETELRSVRELFLMEAQRTARLQSELSAARAEVTQTAVLLNDTIERADVERRELERVYRDEIEQLRAALEATQSDSARLRDEYISSLGAKRDVIHSLRRCLGDLLGVRDRLARRAEAAEAEVASLRGDISRLHAEGEESRAALRDLMRELQAGEVSAQGALESLGTALVELRAANGDLEKALRGVLGSRSWRLTRPIRWLFRVLRGGRGRGH